jgi:DmsE family decaheme c-type cytochrome
MHSPKTFGFARNPSCAAQDATGQRHRIISTRTLATFAASGLVFWSLCGLAPPLRAEQPQSDLSFAALQNFVQQASVADDDYSPLRSFVQLMGSEAPTPIAAKTGNSGPQVDDAYAALRDFTARMGGDEPQAPRIQLAEANNLLDFLREKAAGEAAPAPKSVAPVKAAPSKAVKAVPTDATYVGSNVCLGCHTPWLDAFSKTLMGRLFKQGKLQCESCHGPGSAHVKAGGGRGVGGIISFRKEDTSRTAEENNAICLGCHEKGDRTYWSGSTHETRGLACTNCHTIMKEVSRKHQLKTAFEPDTCFQCHKDRRAQLFRSAHMPMREGKIVCSDCHNPHGSFTEALLRENSINDTCYKCHAEKRGPFLFEHAPVRENCVNCHNPHGSMNEYSLKVSRPRLCAECHAMGHGYEGGTAVVQGFSRSCQNCHTEVHGTNSPSGALLHR